MMDIFWEKIFRCVAREGCAYNYRPSWAIWRGRFKMNDCSFIKMNNESVFNLLNDASFILHHCDIIIA
jgi:hypothetical protein